MKNHVTNYLLKSIILPCIMFGSLSGQAPDTLWTRIYGINGPFEWFQSVQQLPDSGYILTGEWDGDLLLMRTDSHGDSLWTKTYGGTGEDCGFCVRRTSDDGYIVAGLNAVNSGDLWLLRTDANGDTLWTKTYGSTQDDIGFWVEQTPGGGFIVFGQSESFGGVYGAWLLKTGSSGDTLWTEIYDGYAGNPGRSFCQTDDGGYILAANKQNGIDYKAYVIRTDSLGDTLWIKTCGGLGNDVFSAIVETDDGGYVFTGHTSQSGVLLTDGWVVKTDSLGDSLWAYIYGGEGTDEFRSIQQTPDGGFILAGGKNFSPMGYVYMWLMKVDAAGDSVWAQTWGMGQMCTGDEIGVCCDEGYIIAGSVLVAGTYDDAWLVRTEPDIGIREYEKDRCAANMLQITPNPFRNNTYVTLSTGQYSAFYELEIYNVSGRLVKLYRMKSSGGNNSRISWDGTDQAGRPVPSGVYFIKLRTGNYTDTRKLLLVR